MRRASLLLLVALFACAAPPAPSPPAAVPAQPAEAQTCEPARGFATTVVDHPWLRPADVALVYGQVLTADGSPIVGARLRLTCRERRTPGVRPRSPRGLVEAVESVVNAPSVRVLHESVSGGIGDFAFTIAGSQRMESAFDEFLLSVEVPATGAVEFCAVGRFEAGHARRVRCVPRNVETVRVRVLDERGEPASGVHVRYEGQVVASGRRFFPYSVGAKTAADGWAEVPFPVRERLWVTASQRGSVARKQVLERAPFTTHLRLVRGANLEGVVAIEGLGVPLAGWRVRGRPEDESAPWGAVWTDTDSNGRFVLEDLAPGVPYMLTAERFLSRATDAGLSPRSIRVSAPAQGLRVDVEGGGWIELEFYGVTPLSEGWGRWITVERRGAVGWETIRTLGGGLWPRPLDGWNSPLLPTGAYRVRGLGGSLLPTPEVEVRPGQRARIVATVAAHRVVSARLPDHGRANLRVAVQFVTSEGPLATYAIDVRDVLEVHAPPEATAVVLSPQGYRSRRFELAAGDTFLGELELSR